MWVILYVGGGYFYNLLCILVQIILYLLCILVENLLTLYQVI